MEAIRGEKVDLESEIASVRDELNKVTIEAGSTKLTNHELEDKVRSLNDSVRHLSDAAESYQVDIERLENEITGTKHDPESVNDIFIKGVVSVASTEETKNDGNLTKEQREKWKLSKRHFKLLQKIGIV